jgi:hypothetical protein
MPYYKHETKKLNKLYCDLCKIILRKELVLHKENIKRLFLRFILYSFTEKKLSKKNKQTNRKKFA